ncbi:MAG: hypothetical protein R3F54_31725 [Alphaproteobacteria bacterium]
MRDDAFPIIGHRRVDEIGSADVLDVLQPIWLAKPETARRVWQRMRAIFDWAIAKHYRETMNPVDAGRRALPKQPSKNGHHAALPCLALLTFIDGLRAAKAHDLVKIGLEFLIHTATRTGEVLGARWEEIHTDKAI